MNINRPRYWMPSVLGALASGTFLALHVNRPWIVAGEPTPILVPCLATLVILAGCLADAGIMLRKTRAAKSEDEPKPDLARLTWYFGALLAFAVLMKPFGFIPLVAIVFPLLLTFGERIPFRRAAVITLVTGFVVYVVFERLLAVDLPQGTLISAWL
jgi:hypothetical protein